MCRLECYMKLRYSSYLWAYDLQGPVRNAFDAGRYITRASGRGLDPGNRDFFGPCEMIWSRQASSIRAQKVERN